ncbi:hypothetical protein [Phenylobacterium sp.]|uniref:hypothetical protein n=1 Tax=Phenylobacterium sp. TaxID=1871053 RepID=UPI0025DEFA47|nr:hypothetical protein [Phenylobacterium sp.]
MNKILTAAIAAITLGGAVSATATAADARPYGGHGNYGGHYGRGYGGAALAGVAGLAIGAAIAGPHYYGGPYYGPAYYGPGYYGTCYTTRWAWDPYAGRRVPVQQPYAC